MNLACIIKASVRRLETGSLDSGLDVILSHSLKKRK